MAGGVFSASKAATDDEFILTGAVVPVSSFNKYLLMRDSANVASIIEGIPASTAAGVRFPALPANKACVGYVQVATNGATTFTPGVTALNAAGITATFVNGLDRRCCARCKSTRSSSGRDDPTAASGVRGGAAPPVA
jgi:hypothetical protein